jgi:hypothetical protein
VEDTEEEVTREKLDLLHGQSTHIRNVVLKLADSVRVADFQ